MRLLLWRSCVHRVRIGSFIIISAIFICQVWRRNWARKCTLWMAIEIFNMDTVLLGARMGIQVGLTSVNGGLFAELYRREKWWFISVCCPKQVFPMQFIDGLVRCWLHLHINSVSRIYPADLCHPTSLDITMSLREDSFNLSDWTKRPRFFMTISDCLKIHNNEKKDHC